MTFAQLIGKYLGQPFREGGSRHGGFDCLGLMYAISQERDMYFPEEFDGWDRNNYHRYYQRDPAGAVDSMIRFFDTFATRVDAEVAGDLLLVEQPDGTRFPAIYAGNQQAVTSFTRKGVSVFRLDDANNTVHVWRLKKCLHR